MHPEGLCLLKVEWARQSWKKSLFTISQFWASHSLTKDSFWGYLWDLGHQFASSFLQLIGPPGGTTLLVSCRTSLLHAWCSFSWESPCPLQLPVARQAEERGRSNVALLIGCFQVIAWMNGDSVPRFWPMTYWKMNTKSFVRFRTLPSTHPAASKIFKFMVLMNVCKPSTITRLPDYQSQFSWIFDFHGAHEFLWCEIQAGESGSGAFRILCLDTKSTWPVHVAATKWFVGVEVCRVRGDNIEISKGCRNTMNTGIWRLYHHKKIVSFQFLVACDHFILDEAEDHVKRAIKL